MHVGKHNLSNFLLCALSLGGSFYFGNGMISVSTGQSRKLTKTPKSFISDAEIARLSPSIYESDCYLNEDDAFDDEYDDMLYEKNVLKEGMETYQELQRSTGSEILNDELQQQIDQSSTSPDAFLENHIDDASMMEKIAMSSIPQQLPRPAVDALSNASKNPSTSSLKNMNYARGRVTPEQEIELARIIQRGVAIFKIKSDFVEKEGREISKQEWTELAGLKSPRELRRQVSDYRKAKGTLVSANMGLVHSVVKSQFYNLQRKTGTSFEELVQEGSLGLLRASELFDPSRGLRFSTYATIWIKGTLSNSHSVETIKLPARERTKWNKITKAHNEISKERGAEPTVEELAEHLGMKVSDIVSTKRKMTQAQQVLSLDYEYATKTRSGIDSGGSKSLQDDDAFREDADLAERIHMHADVVAAMARNLDAREARLMRLRYGLVDGNTRSLKQCAEAMGLSEARVQQLAKRCLKKLREASEAKSLEEYLLTVA